MSGLRLWTAAGALAALAGAGILHAARSTPGGSAPRPGLRAHIDPETGRLTHRPAAGAAPAPPRLQAKDAGLVATAGSTPAGGLSVDIRGRYRTTLRATVGADGRATARCE